MDAFFVFLWLVIVGVLIIFAGLFPGFNFFTIFNPKKKYYYKAVLSNNQLMLSGLKDQINISVNEIKRLSMGPFALRSLLAEKGMFAVQIDTLNDKYYLFQSPLNLFAPALKRDIIKQLKTINPNIELDYNLKKYTDESLPDMYINKEQIKRGLFVILLFAVLFLLAYLESHIKKLLGK